jgi:hypothetical protein
MDPVLSLGGFSSDSGSAQEPSKTKPGVPNPEPILPCCGPLFSGDWLDELGSSSSLLLPLLPISSWSSLSMSMRVDASELNLLPTRVDPSELNLLSTEVADPEL